MSRRVALARGTDVADQGQVPKPAKPAKPPKLKVYRTPIGFHDAYVAAPSQKAALAAWGSDANLFARGVAEEVTDPALTAEPLAQAGKVIKRLRGSVAEQFAALPPDAPKADRSRSQSIAGSPRSPARKARAPKPDRAPLTDAEQALAAAQGRQRDENKALAEREAELARERRALADRQEAESAELEAAVEQARAAYDRAMDAWRR